MSAVAIDGFEPIVMAIHHDRLELPKATHAKGKLLELITIHLCSWLVGIGIDKVALNGLSFHGFCLAVVGVLRRAVVAASNQTRAVSRHCCKQKGRDRNFGGTDLQHRSTQKWSELQAAQQRL